MGKEWTKLAMNDILIIDKYCIDNDFMKINCNVKLRVT